MEYRLNEELREILKPAYYPCAGFTGVCKGIKKEPSEGYIPRGFFGCLGEISQVELILVIAEPGSPFSKEEKYPDFSEELIDLVFDYVGTKFEKPTDPFHKNIQNILDMCWPNLSFREKFEKVWLTDSVLCSAEKPCEEFSKEVSQFCGQTYLQKQLNLFSKDILLISMGRKAQRRLKEIGKSESLFVYSPACFGKNLEVAKNLWKQIPEKLKERSS